MKRKLIHKLLVTANCGCGDVRGPAGTAATIDSALNCFDKPSNIVDSGAQHQGAAPRLIRRYAAVEKKTFRLIRTISPCFGTAILSLMVALAPVLIETAQAQQSPTAQEAYAIGLDAYIYGYSLITTDVTRVQMSNVPEVQGMKAPMGEFFNVLRYPPGDYRGVSAPNGDTLYSLAWIDLGKEPMVFTYPDMGKRYFLFPMYSLWMPVVESLGSRTTGEGAGKYLITGPGWEGEVPAGLKQIKSPTRYFLILGRTYADGSEEDYKTVNDLQAQYKLVPLSAYGKPYTYVAPKVDENPGFSMTAKPQDVILGMTTSEYFNRMATLMGDAAPPAPEDAPIVAEMAKIGPHSRPTLRHHQA